MPALLSIRFRDTPCNDGSGDRTGILIPHNLVLDPEATMHILYTWNESFQLLMHNERFPQQRLQLGLWTPVSTQMTLPIRLCKLRFGARNRPGPTPPKRPLLSCTALFAPLRFRFHDGGRRVVQNGMNEATGGRIVRREWTVGRSWTWTLSRRPCLSSRTLSWMSTRWRRRWDARR